MTLAVLAAFGGLTLATARAAADGIAPTTFTLANGLDVIVIEDHRMPVATHMVWYRVGAADEPKGKSGIAHFLEHLMFKGTNEIPEGEFSKIVARNGGQDNAFTSWDFTAYFQRVAVDRLPLVMKMEADRMANLKLSEEAVLTERDVILEERKMRVDNNPAAILREKMGSVQYKSHPYGIPIIGWEDEIAQLNRADAIAFYEKYYNPANAILIVAGAVTPDEVRTLAEETYGKIEGHALPQRMRPPEPPPTEAKRVVYEDARVKQPSLQVWYRAPSIGTASTGEAEALAVLAGVLGDGPTSRLYKALVTDKKIASAVSVNYDGTGFDETDLSISATPRPGVTLDDLEAAVNKEVEAFLASGPTAEEIKRTVTTIKNGYIYGQDSQMSLAYLFGTALTSRQSMDDVLKWPERVERVTPEQVLSVGKTFLRPERSVVGRLVPAPKS